MPKWDDGDVSSSDSNDSFREPSRGSAAGTGVCVCAACCCCILQGLLIFLIVVWLTKQPLELKLNGFAFDKLSVVNDDADLSLRLFMSATNPNIWPLSLTLETLKADVASLDKSNLANEIIPLGVASLVSSVELEPRKEVAFEAFFSTDIQQLLGTYSESFLARMVKDCTPIVSSGQTMLRVTVTEATGSFHGIPIDLGGMEVQQDCLASCRLEQVVDHTLDTSCISDLSGVSVRIT